MKWGVFFGATSDSSPLHTELFFLLSEIFDLWLIAVEFIGGASKFILSVISLSRSDRPPQLFGIRRAGVLRRYELGKASMRHPLVLALRAY